MSEEVDRLIKASSIKALTSRKIRQETCRKFDYRVRLNSAGEQEHIAVYRDEMGQPEWVKIRNTGTPKEPKKGFATVGPTEQRFFGQHLWSGGGKRLVIVGGEIDCLTVSQAQDDQWPVVSPPLGEKGIVKALKANFEWVNSFQEVVLGLDMDGPGREANLEAAALLPPGKAKIAKWTRKDPNEMLVEGDGKEIIRCIWNAETFRPDGLIDARTLTERCLSPTQYGLPWPWRFLTDWTYGRRRGEAVLFGAGTGLGKTDFIAEIVACDLRGKTKFGLEYEPQGWGIFAFEAGAATTKKAIAGKMAERRFHIPDADWTDVELTAAMKFMDEDCWNRGGKLFINDSLGMADFDAIVDRVRFLVQSEGISHFLIDPVGALVMDAEDERKELDALSLRWAKLQVELDTHGYMTSHLTRPSMGPSHEEGGHVQLKQFRGSNGLVMYHNAIFGLERNQQGETEYDRCTTSIRDLKDRFTGNPVGKVESLHYNVLNGMLEVEYNPEDEQPL